MLPVNADLATEYFITITLKANFVKL